MVPANMLERVLLVRFHRAPDATGSAFTVDVDERQYIVTAAHVVPGLAKSDVLGVFYAGGFRDVPVRRVYLDHAVDVAVLAANEELTPTLPVVPSTEGLYVSQDVFFLGFPYKFFSSSLVLNDNRPIPFVKKGIVSLFDLRSDKMLDLYVDGHNNPGFSGGPLVYTAAATGEFHVAGIVTSFREEKEPIYQGDEKTALVARLNTGIIRASDIGHVVAAVRRKASGPLVRSD